MVRVFPADYEEALTMSRELGREGERADVFVAAGANGAYLSDHADVPVILVRSTALDVIQALIAARARSRATSG